MAQESLIHKDKKDSTVKWFIFMLIPILNLYWLWKAAEVVSGHGKHISRKYEALMHLDRKDSTAKWFVIFLIPAILGALSSLSLMGGIYSDSIRAINIGLAGAAGVLMVIALVIGIYILYKLAETVSGHETVYPKEYETVGHKDRKDSTAKWFVFGIIPILNLYFAWKMSETISGHENVYSS